MRKGDTSELRDSGRPAATGSWTERHFGSIARELNPRGYCRLYLLLALPMLLALNIVFPAFHAADDYDHAKRASTLMSGDWRPTTLPGRSSGGPIDTGLIAYIRAQAPVVMIKYRPLSDTEQAEYQNDHSIRWSGHRQYSEAPGAMSYFPLLYAPQGVAMVAAKSAGATVETSILLARLANGLAGVLLVALGLRLLTTGHALVLVTMLLPKSLLQFASNSADPILYGAAIILVAIGIRSWKASRSPAGTTVWAGLLCFVASGVRLPLVVLSLPFAVNALRTRAWLSLALIGLSVLGVGFWFATTLPSIVDLRCGEIGVPSAKIGIFALHWPTLIGRSIVAHYAYYLMSFIGELGWGHGPRALLDEALPAWAYVGALAMLGLACRQDRAIASPLPFDIRMMLVFMALAMILLVFFAMFAGCTDPAHTTISGVQGRYFVPSVIALAPAFAGASARSSRPGNQRQFIVFLVAWCVADLVMLCLQSHAIYQHTQHGF